MVWINEMNTIESGENKHSLVRFMVEETNENFLSWKQSQKLYDTKY